MTLTATSPSASARGEDDVSPSDIALGSADSVNHRAASIKCRVFFHPHNHVPAVRALGEAPV